jgi:hypothetical protein
MKLMFDSLRFRLPMSWLKAGWISFLSICFAVLCLLTSCTNSGNIDRPAGGQPTGAVSPGQQDQSQKSLGTFSRVAGTRYLYAQISQSPDGSVFSSSYRDSSGGNVHNVVYFDPTSGKLTQLLPTNDALIASTIALPEVAVSQDPKQVDWFLYGIVKKDTDNDRKLTHKDQMVLAMADAGGQGYTELVDGIDQLYGQTLNDANTLTVIYSKSSRLFHSTVNLPKRQVTATKEFPGFGKDVKLAG